MVYSVRKFEAENKKQIEKQRMELITRHCIYCRDNSPYYRELFDKAGINPEEIRTLDDFTGIPPVTKEDLRLKNTSFFAVSNRETVDMMTTSGTTGKPVYIPVTKEDLERTAVGGAQTLALSGASAEDIVHLTMPMSAWMWMAGYGFYLCFTCLGSTVLRFGPGFSEKSIETLVNLNADILAAAPSFALHLGRTVRESNVSHNIRRIYTVGESVMNEDLTPNALGKKIQELWGAELFSCYGATEGPFMAVECGFHRGHHINPYEVFIEILDPETLNPLPRGKKGLVAVTPLSVRGFPLIRYINGDISFMPEEPCPCGGMLDTLGPVLARKDHMVKVKGVMVYPQAIGEIIANFEGEEDLFLVEAYYRQLANWVQVLVAENESPGYTDRLSEAIRRKLGVSVDVKAVKRELLQERVHPPGSRKPVNFIDLRKSDL